MSIRSKATAQHDTLSPEEKKFLFLLTMLASIGGGLFGYDTGVVSGAMLLLASNRDKCPKYGGFDLSNFEQEVVVDATIGGAIIGCVLSGFFCDKFGRKPVMVAGAILFVLGSVLLSLANGLALLVVGRVVVGLAVGFASHTTPVYLGELAPPHLRGRVVSTFNTCIVIGQVLACAIDGAFFYIHEGWRFMLGFAAILAISQLIGFVFLPESPRWLVKKGRIDEAIAVLQRVRVRKDVSNEIEHIKTAINESALTVSWKEILSTPIYRRPLFLGCFLMFLQQFVGINTVMYYSATILSQAGFGGRDGICCCEKDAIPIWLSAMTGAAQLIGCLTGMRLIDYYGRRTLIMASLVGVCVALVILSIGFFQPHGIARDVCCMVGLLGYLLSFGSGMSPVPWVMNSEIYQSQARSQSSSAAVGVNWIGNFIIAGTFLTASEKIGRGETFLVFAGIGVLGWIWLAFNMPETKGKTLEQITDSFGPRKGVRLLDQGE